MPGPLVESLIAEIASRLRAGALDDAEALLAALVAQALPRSTAEDAEILHLRGLIALQREDVAGAAALLAQAVALWPAEARFHGNLAIACRRLGNPTGAEAAYRSALALEPARAEYHANLGNLLKDLDRPEEARLAYSHALALAPDYHKVRFNLGNLLHDLLRLDEAEQHLGMVSAAGGETATAARLNLGRVLEKTGRRVAARECYEQVLREQPAHIAARWNRALLLLQNGDLAAGFRDYEWRWHLPEHSPRPFSKPVWQGEDLAGQTLLVHAEQGFGDTIQFCRYLPLLAGRVGRVIFECQAPLLRLMSRSFAGLTVTSDGPSQSFDRHVPLLSLPLLLGTRSIADIPAPVPYLHGEAPIGEVETSLTVGLVWAGSPGHNLHSMLRSIPPDDLAPLFHIAGVRLVSLQVGDHAADCAALGLTDMTPRLRDFADTADLIAGLDLVITIDTAVAHLAGALGKPAWILLRASPDWRWFVDRSDTPWYPTASLFRQDQIGHWRPLIEQVAARLRELARVHAAKSMPHDAEGPCFR